MFNVKGSIPDNFFHKHFYDNQTLKETTMPNPIFEDFCKVTCSYDGKFVSVVVEIVKGDEDDVSVIFRRHENESNVIGEFAVEEGLIREDIKIKF